MKYTGTDMESFRKESRIDAARRVKSQLVIDAVAKAEDIKATEEEINAKVDEYKTQKSIQDAAKISKSTMRRLLLGNLRIR